MFSKKSNQNNKIRTGSFSSKTIPIRNNGDNYFYVDNFEQTTKKECQEYDKYNQKIYQKYIKLYDKISKTLDDCPFKLDKKPKPPKKPNNYESLIKWRSMNISKNVSHQTICILYLLSRGIFNLSLDFNKKGILPSDICEIAEKKCNSDMELMKKEAYLFLEKNKDNQKIKDLNNHDSLYLHSIKLTNNKPQQHNENQSKQNNQPQQQQNKPKIKYKKIIQKTISSPTINNKYNSSNLQNRIINSNNNNLYHGDNLSINSDIEDNNIDFGFEPNNNKTMICENPEHHSIHKKIHHFDSSFSKKQNNNNTIYPTLSLNINTNPNTNNISNGEPSAPPPPEYNV